MELTQKNKERLVELTKNILDNHNKKISIFLKYCK